MNGTSQYTGNKQKQITMAIKPYSDIGKRMKYLSKLKDRPSGCSQ